MGASDCEATEGKQEAASRTVVEEENNWFWKDLATKKSSYKEHRVDAKAPYAEEGRGKLRKVTRSRKQAMNRKYPNGETRRE